MRIRLILLFQTLVAICLAPDFAQSAAGTGAKRLFTIGSSKLLGLVSLIAAVAFSVFAIAEEKPKENKPEVKFTARTELVLIPTLVTDKSGAHIGGLKKEEL